MSLSDPRYFTDGVSIWKFAPGRPPQNRFSDESTWDESAFTSLEEFEETSGDVREITLEEGEP